MVTSVDSKEHLETLCKEAGTKLVVVDFYAVWCGPCKYIAPVLETMSTEEPDVVFLKVDVDINEDLVSLYDISSMPTFVFIKEGKKVDSFSGANIEKLKEMITRLKKKQESE